MDPSKDPGESAAGSGVSVVVPVYNEADNIGRLVPQILAQDPRLSVLVVDDNEVNLLVAQRMLEQLGYEVETSASGEEAIELAKRWKPILDHADKCGVDLAYEIHPGEDLHDGVTFEMFLERVGNHPRCNMLYDPSHYVLQALDYLDNIDIYHERIGMFHVKDAEFNPTGRQGVYSGYQPWVDRAGRCRSEVSI